MLWKQYFTQTILMRGRDYFRRGKVLKLSHVGESYTAQVMGSRLYTVKITEQDGEFYHGVCDCPHSRSGYYCKHVAAALFAIDFADKQALADMKTGLEIINFVRQKKAEMQVSIKVPIKKLVVPAMPKTIEEDIKAMLSVENVEVGSELMVEI